MHDEDCDFAVLRLEDREDKPLVKWGVIPVDSDAPITLVTTLCVLQHPGGQIQSVSKGGFRLAFRGDRFLYDAPTEEGTSGARYWTPPRTVPSVCTGGRT